MKRLGLVLTAAASTMLVTAPASSQATTAPTTTRPVAGDSSRPNGMLNDAVDAYKAGRYDEAAKIALSVSKQIKRKPGVIEDPLLLDSLHLQLVSHMKLSRHSAAADAANQLFPNAPTDRALLLNVAACDVRQRSYVIRSVRLLKAFAMAHPHDEEAVSMWGAAIAVMAKQSKPTDLQEQVAAYQEVEAQLETTKPGMKRWGTRWISAAEYSELEKERRRVEADVKAKAEHVESARQTLDKAAKAVERARERERVEILEHQGDMDHPDRLRAQRRAREAERAHDRARAEYKRAVAAAEKADDAMPKPTWVAPVGPVEPAFLR